jgi:hypothetical protein
MFHHETDSFWVFTSAFFQFSFSWNGVLEDHCQQDIPQLCNSNSL